MSEYRTHLVSSWTHIPPVVGRAKRQVVLQSSWPWQGGPGREGVSRCWIWATQVGCGQRSAAHLTPASTTPSLCSRFRLVRSYRACRASTSASCSACTAPRSRACCSGAERASRTACTHVTTSFAQARWSSAACENEVSYLWGWGEHCLFVWRSINMLLVNRQGEDCIQLSSTVIICCCWRGWVEHGKRSGRGSTSTAPNTS